jgi:hypothetical protein
LIQENQVKEASTMKSSSNPWQTVLANVTFNSSGTTATGKDVSRMKAAMIARKTDLTQK